MAKKVLSKAAKAPSRVERDSLGEKSVPTESYYGIQTLRAVENFPVSGLKAHPALIRAYASIKKACALANKSLGKLDAMIADPIIQASDEVLRGRFDDQFVVDVYQAGAGTSFNMNANEVIANRAAELLGEPRGEYRRVHPNDHVNMSQSTNDTFPTASCVACLAQVRELAPVLDRLADAFKAKGREFHNVVKSARTHLQDAVPITLGQEFSAYGAAVSACARELARRSELLRAVALGGTAAGTGANASIEFRRLAIQNLARITGLPLVAAADPRMALQSHQPLQALSSALKETALELIRIANDLRLLASGPMTGFAEILLPAVQPGSSIMPGKVNPSILECLNMICFQIVGRDAAVALATQAGQMDLNVMTPLTAYNLLDSMELLIRFLPVADKRCVAGISAEKERCRAYFEKSPSLAALLNPKIGYAKAAQVFKEAVASDLSIPEVARKHGLLSPAEIKKLFDPRAVTGILDHGRSKP